MAEHLSRLLDPAADPAIATVSDGVDARVNSPADTLLSAPSAS